MLQKALCTATTLSFFTFNFSLQMSVMKISNDYDPQQQPSYNFRWVYTDFVCLILELKEAVEDVLPSLVEQGVTVLLITKHCDTPGIDSFSDKVEGAPDCPLPPSLRSHVTLKSPAVYIYTSGTTGKSHCSLENLISFCSLWPVSSQASPRQRSSIRTACSQFWLFCHQTGSRLMTSSTSTCLFTTPLDFLSGLLAPSRQVRWC